MIAGVGIGMTGAPHNDQASLNAPTNDTSVAVRSLCARANTTTPTTAEATSSPTTTQNARLVLSSKTVSRSQSCHVRTPPATAVAKAMIDPAISHARYFAGGFSCAHPEPG
jgi:hypothetical protein